MIIAIEGIDGVGKGTQSVLLANHLNQNGKPTTLISLPDYGNTTGQSIKRYLNGEFDGTAYAMASLFAANRVEKMADTFRHDPVGNIVFNRYVLSNAAYQSFRFPTVEGQRKFIDWVFDLEFNKLMLPRPDLTIVLDLPVGSAIEQMQNRQGDHRDFHEGNIKLLQYCREVYLSMAYLGAAGLKYKAIDCFNRKTGGIRSIDDIHDEIVSIVHKSMVDLTS